MTVKRRLDKLEQSTAKYLVIFRSTHGGGKITGYTLANGEQLTVQPTDTSESLRGKARTAAKALGRPISIIRATYGDNQCQC